AVRSLGGRGHAGAGFSWVCPSSFGTLVRGILPPRWDKGKSASADDHVFMAAACRPYRQRMPPPPAWPLAHAQGMADGKPPAWTHICTFAADMQGGIDQSV